MPFHASQWSGSAVFQRGCRSHKQAQSMRGKRNEPSYLPVIAEKIAELKQLTVEEVAYKTTENARKMFNII